MVRIFVNKPCEAGFFSFETWQCVSHAGCFVSDFGMLQTSPGIVDDVEWGSNMQGDGPSVKAG